MGAHALAFESVRSTGNRAVSVPCRDVYECVSAGGRLVKTRREYALFDDAGRFVGTVHAPHAGLDFGPAARTVLLSRGI